MSPRFGPSLEEGSVTLRCWAPGAGRVEVVLEAGARVGMRPEADCFFSAELGGCGPGLRYRFSRDGEPPLPDPASRFQPEGAAFASQLVDLGYSWGDAGWPGIAPEELVVYELHVGTFSPEGSYSGVEAKLDHLAGLGVTALELMPLATFPGARGWGYDGTFHFAPFAGYGEPRDLQRLVDACHARGLGVILDLVTNHFGPEGNAMWGLAPLFFRPDRPTAWSSGINWDAAPVLDYFAEVASFWAREYHLDGLRLDAFHAVPREARGLHLRRMLDAVAAELAPGRRFTTLLESVDNQRSLLERPEENLHVTQLNFDFQRASHALLTGERHGEYQDFDSPATELGKVLSSGFAFLGRFSGHHRRVRGESSAPTTWDAVVNYLQNHDTAGNRHLGQRLDRLVPPAALEAATALLLLHPGLPCLFMGQEWGASTPFYFFTDLPAHLLASVRAGRRAGFRELDPDRCPDRAPDCAEEQALACSRLAWDELDRSPHRERLVRTRELLELRRRLLPRISRQVSDTSVEVDGACFVLRALGREPADRPLLLCANLQDGPAPAPAADALIYSTRPLRDGHLPPWTTAVFSL